MSLSWAFGKCVQSHYFPHHSQRRNRYYFSKVDATFYLWSFLLIWAMITFSCYWDGFQHFSQTFFLLPMAFFYVHIVVKYYKKKQLQECLLMFCFLWCRVVCLTTSFCVNNTFFLKWDKEHSWWRCQGQKLFICNVIQTKCKENDATISPSHAFHFQMSFLKNFLFICNRITSCKKVQLLFLAVTCVDFHQTTSESHFVFRQ